MDSANSQHPNMMSKTAQTSGGFAAVVVIVTATPTSGVLFLYP